MELRKEIKQLFVASFSKQLYVDFFFLFTNGQKQVPKHLIEKTDTYITVLHGALYVDFIIKG